MATQQQVQEAITAALEADRAARVAAVSVKLPQFWPDKTKLWFAQAEAQFEVKGITVEKTKYNYVVSMLDSKTAVQAMDIIETPPDNPYTALKNRLTKAYALSESEMADRILDMNGIGDNTPSQCLADMLLLVPQRQAQDPGYLFRQIFLRQLPADVRTQLAQTTKTGTTAAALRELAAEADKYFASTGSRISGVASSSSVTPTPATYDWGQAATPSPEADTEVVAVASRGQYRGKTNRGGFSRGGQNRGGRSRSGLGTTPNITVCPYHLRYGEEARRCQPPCEFKEKASGNSLSGCK